MTTSQSNHIVVIDDERAIVELIQQGLSARGYYVQGFTNPEDAITMLESSTLPDAFVVDVNMPRVSGIDFFEYCRQDPHLRAIPMILMSGFDPHTMRRRTMRIGVDDFLDKPFSLEELSLTIEARLKRVQELSQKQSEKRDRVTLKTLGAVYATKNSKPVDRLPLRALEMLCLLLDHPKGMRLFEIGEAMWSELDERRASNNFHATLFRCRQTFGKEIIEKASGLYHLSQQVDFSYDVHLFLQLDPCNGSHRERASALYQGEFLPDASSRWVNEKREVLAKHFARLTTNTGK